MTQFTWGRSVIALFASVAICLLGRPAQAQYLWNVPAGDYNVPGNWNLGSVPGQFDEAVINNGGTSTFSSGTNQLDILNVASAGGSSGAFNMTGGSLDAFQVKYGEGGTATGSITGGTLTVGNGSLFVGPHSGGGTGVLTVSGASTVVTSADDIQFGRSGTGTLNMSGGLMKGGYTVVGKFGTGFWNHSGGVFDQDFGDIEIGDGGTPGQAGEPGPRTGTINLTGGVIQGAGHLAISNRRGTGTVNVSGGALALTGAVGDGAIIIGRGADWDGNPGTGGPTELRVTGDDAIVIANGNLEMNLNGISTTSTLVAEITGTTHTTIKVAGDALIGNGILKVDLTGYTPVSGNSWTILTAGVDLTADKAAVDALVSAGGYPALTHNEPNALGTLQGTFASTDFSLAPLSPGLSWNVAYVSNSVVLSVTGTGPAFSADFDANGQVNGLDLAKWRNDFGPANGGSDADDDGDSDGADFLAWQRQLGSGVPAAVSVAAIPEPAAATLAMCGVALLMTAARRRTG
jgi:T5SS/PEP-CTERM-associated repeat protein